MFSSLNGNRLAAAQQGHSSGTEQYLVVVGDDDVSVVPEEFFSLFSTLVRRNWYQNVRLRLL